MSALISLLAVLGAANAQDDDDRGWATHGEVRELVQSGTDFAVDNHGTTVGQGVHLDQRIRAGVHYKGYLTEFHTEWDLATGQLAGDTWDIVRSQDERRRDVQGALTLGGIQPRQLSVGGYVGNAKVEAGLMTSHWGLGLLANDGDHEPLFGREDFGDRVFRAKATFMPWKDRVGAAAPTFFVVALDTVLADDLARLDDGQLANQAIVALLHDKGEDEAKYGVYAVFRNQMEPGWTRSTQAGVIDVYASQPIELNDTWTLTVSTESVGIIGQTSRGQSYGAPFGLAVANFGTAAQTKLGSDKLDLHLNAGFASGDGNPDDKRSNDFLADRDFNVGMVLFDEVMGNIDAGTLGIVNDPQWTGRAPDGAELLATEGAWRRSAYLQPVVAVRPLGQLELRVGAVIAGSTAPVSQPFYTVRNGGTPTNHLDQVTTGKRALGTELDWAIRISPDDPEVMEEWAIRPRLEVQGGHAMLGEALGGGTVTLIQSAIRVEW